MALQRIRDPLHNLIVFNTNHQLERTLWSALCSRPFQRLRRIKQLGFSELVYPGASHSRFAHSIGVFHTARRLMQIIQEHEGQKSEAREQVALAAALVHDVGHGPFSHAFESVGRELGLKFADHELMSDTLIRDGELSEILKDMGSGFANDVADMVKGEGKKTVHNAVVSSQFDADRLDYMQRDRLMTGSQHSAIDFTWLLANLQISDVPVGVDDAETGKIPTFVIGPKAIHAAEAYVLGLFQLYPTVYFHKATRGAEKIFSQLLIRVVTLVTDGNCARVGLPHNHPLIQFAKSPESIEAALSLDDTVVWGALSQLRDAEDSLVASFAESVQDRRLYKCLDIRTTVQHEIDPENKQDPEHVSNIDKCCALIAIRLRELEKEESSSTGAPIVLLDEEKRSPYKDRDGAHGPTEQINVETDGGVLIDLKQRSEVVRALQDFKLLRAYFDRRECGVEDRILAIVAEEVKECQ